MHKYKTLTAVAAHGYARYMIGFSFVCGSLSVPVHAQEMGKESDIIATLEEIVVTARKRTEDLQDTPISVTAFGAGELEARGIDNLLAVANSTPNLGAQTAANGGLSSANFFIRGVGQFDFISTVEPSVGLYIDGIYVGRSVGAALDVVDFAQFEVLRGPQGTLFGRNTTGGAINITTVKPENELGGSFEVTLGRYDRLDAKGVANLPLTDDLALRLSAASLNRDGYAENRNLGIRTAEIDNLVFRSDLLWDATENFSLRLTADAQYKRGAGGPETADVLNVGPGTGLGAYNAMNLAPQGLPLIGPAFLDTSPYVSFNGEKSIDEYDILGVAATAEWSLGNANIRSLTGYRTLESSNGYDFDGTPYPILEQEIYLDQSQFSQELQGFGNAFDGHFNWIAGVYFFREETDETQFVSLFETVTATGDGKFEPTGKGLFPGTGPFLNEPNPTTTSYAVFAEGQWAFTNRLDASLGIRFTREEKEYISQLGGAFTRPRLSQDLAWNDVSPRLVIQYRADTDVLLYGSVSKGFRSGGFNGRTLAAAPPESFEPEEILAYEIGVKSEWLNNRLRVNASAFLYDYTNYQGTTLSSGAVIVGNIADVRLSGGELELVAQPTTHLKFGLGAGFLHDEIKDFVAGAANITIRPDTDLIQTPDHTLSAYADYVVPLGEGTLLSFHADVFKKAAFEFLLPNQPLEREDGYTLVNAMITLAFDNEDWQFQLFGTNLTDEAYKLNSVDETPFGFEAVTSAYGRPREWGLRLRHRF